MIWGPLVYLTQGAIKIIFHDFALVTSINKPGDRNETKIFGFNGLLATQFIIFLQARRFSRHPFR